jgi:hypothetical protein
LLKLPALLASLSVQSAKEVMGKQYEALKAGISSEAAAQQLRQALEAKDAELRKAKYEAESKSKQLEKVRLHQLGKGVHCRLN